MSSHTVINPADETDVQSVRYSSPFGGFKQSGLGRELGPDAPLGFTETTNVFINVEPGSTA